ncbi:serine/threonine protein kinase [Solwaraspora sp. WMMB335]|uniref:serine/threonine protein kinase n=1 Tax=Solwaraspora sp. WMMB335 TaxID=3404118 RepID=UPI003B94A181
MTTAEAIDLVMTARDGTQLFGTSAPARRYHQLARLLHPDTAAGGTAARARATAAFIRLTGLWQQGTAASDVSLDTGRRRYVIEAGPRYAGDLADLYRHRGTPSTGAGRFVDGELVKIPRDPANNDLMAREVTALRQLVDRGDPRYLPYVPRLVDSFRHRDTGGAGTVRQISVVGTATGLRSLAEVRRAYPQGVDPRDAAWMFRRLLVGLGFAHRAGVVHGAVLPDHVLIQPDEHGVVLIDWCYASTSGEAVPALVASYRDWYPDEIRQRRTPGPGTDIAMAAGCLAWLTGDRAPNAIRRFTAGCRLAALRRRPDDAWRLLAEFDDLLERLYGPRRFRPFAVADPIPTEDHDK